MNRTFLLGLNWFVVLAVITVGTVIYRDQLSGLIEGWLLWIR